MILLAMCASAPFRYMAVNKIDKSLCFSWKKTGKISIFRETVNKRGTIQGRACQAGVWGAAGRCGQRAHGRFGGLSRGTWSNALNGDVGSEKCRRSREDPQEAHVVFQAQ